MPVTSSRPALNGYQKGKCFYCHDTISIVPRLESLQVTMDRYGHLCPSDDHKAAMDAIAGKLMG